MTIWPFPKVPSRVYTTGKGREARRTHRFGGLEGHHGPSTAAGHPRGDPPMYGPIGQA